MKGNSYSTRRANLQRNFALSNEISNFNGGKGKACIHRIMILEFAYTIAGTQKLPLMKQRNDEVQTMEEDPTAQRLPFNLGKINAEFSEANSRPKSQGTAQAEECDVNKCCSYCKKYNADLAFVEKADNSAGLELRAIMGQGPKLFIAPKPVLEDGLIQQNFENQEEISAGDLVDQKPIKQSPVNTFAKEKTEGEPESTKARRCTVGNEESKRKAWR
ncbi:hypothetical protein Ancab_036014 [Ancistrocladus abbreviatus]